MRRQSPVGGYIADFLIQEKNLAIEIDGDSHAFSIEKDKERDRFFNNQGLRVVRFTNREVMNNIDGVIETIRQYCENLYQTPT